MSSSSFAALIFLLNAGQGTLGSLSTSRHTSKEVQPADVVEEIQELKAMVAGLAARMGTCCKCKGPTSPGTSTSTAPGAGTTPPATTLASTPVTMAPTTTPAVTVAPTTPPATTVAPATTSASATMTTGSSMGPPATTASTTSTTQSSTVPSVTTSLTLPQKLGLCAVFGDPHFITFDGGHTTFVGDRVLWLVETEAVWMQALSVHSEGKFMGFAAGGPFMQGHTVLLYKDNETAPPKALFDGMPILTQATDEFHQPGIVQAYRTQDWDPNLHNSEILNLRTEMKFAIVDEFKDRFLGTPAGGIFVFRLPGGTEVTVTGVDYMSMVIALAPPSGQQGGYCGNFNGIPDDDFQPVAPSWNRPLGTRLGPVRDDENLFRNNPETRSLLLLADASRLRKQQPVQFPVQLHMQLTEVFKNCPGKVKRKAKQACKGVEDSRMHLDCIVDVCLTKDLSVARDAVVAEVLEEANAFGIPIFMGHGRCLDVEGRLYTSFSTTSKDCDAALRALALTFGVLGAQAHRGSSCQVLVERGVDPRSVSIPGGWGEGVTTQANGEGHGLIRKTTGEADWSCWQLD